MAGARTQPEAAAGSGFATTFEGAEPLPSEPQKRLCRHFADRVIAPH